ncbi:MAG: glycosyl transferase, partial [Lachnospiraceae bacterium]|nr:glycosyl transferase [Lachnospiraceae bacterium]
MDNKPIIATELLKGQGLGNQLFCYVTTRALAYSKGYDFSILNREIFANNIHSNKGMYFMDIDCGIEMDKDSFKNIYHEKEDRIYIGNSIHDIEHGCYISGVDKKLMSLNETTLIYGNLQDEAYFGKYKEQIKKWLKVKPEYDCMDYSRDNLCIINIRGGEYSSNPELFLRRKYWLDAMKKMKEIRSDMEFMVVTDDISAAKRILPEVAAYHFDLAGDYTAIKNARYLILSN